MKSKHVLVGGGILIVIALVLSIWAGLNSTPDYTGTEENATIEPLNEVGSPYIESDMKGKM